MDVVKEFMAQVPHTIADNALVIAVTRLMRERLDDKRNDRYGWHMAGMCSSTELHEWAAAALENARFTDDPMDYVDALNYTAMALVRSQLELGKEIPDGTTEADVGSGS